ncbi:MAG TPA: isocitrate lyase/phosphoenolpyruvate mutase family protein [Edaphocola sp.]|nr:isocitrate lyase/phosphoenolpyruvate mutase family protein [Edaphocola sp.]
MISIENNHIQYESFKALHYNNTPLLLPNIWDPLGALLIQDMGFSAIATSSSALALSEGYTDGQMIPFEELILRLKSIVRGSKLPVSADIENGFANNDLELVDHIKSLLEIGIVGINYEDSNKPENQLISIKIQQERIKLIKDTAQAMNHKIFINARIDTYVHGEHLSHEAKLNETIQRAMAYKEAGADCIFPILLTDQQHIQTLNETLNIPINIMTFPGTPSLKTLKVIGIARISVGGSLMKLALQNIKDFCLNFKELNKLETLFSTGINSEYLNQLVMQNSNKK